MEGKKIHTKYGFITGIITALTGLILYVAGVSFKPGMSYIAYIPFLVGIIMNATAFSKINDGYVSFGDVFVSCFKATMIITLVMIAWSFIAVFAFPAMKDTAIEMARQEMVKKGTMSDEQIDMALGFTKKYFNTFVIAGSIFGNLISGAIFSLIGGAVAQKKGTRPYVPGPQQTN